MKYCFLCVITVWAIGCGTLANTKEMLIEGDMSGAEPHDHTDMLFGEVLSKRNE